MTVAGPDSVAETADGPLQERDRSRGGMGGGGGLKLNGWHQAVAVAFTFA